MDGELEYYDILAVGTKGIGKSSTLDKILLADLDGKVLRDAPSIAISVPLDELMNNSHFMVWLALGNEKYQYETHLKFLHHCQAQDKPHEEINGIRHSGAVFHPTSDCTMVSNELETIKVRIMGVPGFSLGDSTFPTQLKMNYPSSIIDKINLGIMQAILHMQITFGLQFRRILYFLPCRGPLEGENNIMQVKQELRWMAHFFKTSIFKSMVLVATLPEDESRLDLPEDKKFPHSYATLTKHFFCEALKEILPNVCTVPDPPLIFISLTDTCEQILTKVKEAQVQQEYLHIQIDSYSECALCGTKVGVMKDQRVLCHRGEGLTVVGAIPYDESTCHPKFLPRASQSDRAWDAVSVNKSFDNSWPTFVDELLCAACRDPPNTSGCMRVGNEFKDLIKKEKLIVDHNTPSSPEQQVDDSTTGICMIYYAYYIYIYIYIYIMYGKI